VGNIVSQGIPVSTGLRQGDALSPILFNIALEKVIRVNTDRTDFHRLQIVVTDCGTEFLSKVFKEVCNQLNIKQTSTSPYRPQSNGSFEISHRTLGEYLRSLANKNLQNLDAHVPFAMFCHNSTVHSATNF